MALNPLAASAIGTAGQQLLQKGTDKAVQALPREKQNKVRGILMIAGAVVMVFSGIRLMMRKNATPTEG